MRQTFSVYPRYLQFSLLIVVDLISSISNSRINMFYKGCNLFNYFSFSLEPTMFVSRMAGFSVYVSNTTSKKEGLLCFHDNSNTEGKPSVDQSLSCSIYGRYVIYYNERKKGSKYPNYYSKYAYNELCEVEVYGKYINLFF